MPPRSPFASLFLRMTEIHQPNADETECGKCREPLPCDTMRALWIYDLEECPPLFRGVDR